MTPMPYIYYILDEQIVKPVETLEEWATARYDEDEEGKLTRTKDWIVKQETIHGKFISTVFLGMDHGWGEGPPIVFETMVFSKEGDGIEDSVCRYSTWEEAEAGHAKAVELVKNEENKEPVRTEDIKAA